MGSEVQEITFRLNIRVIRKLKALHVLSGSSNFEEAINSSLERALDQGILEHIENAALLKSQPATVRYEWNPPAVPLNNSQPNFLGYSQPADLPSEKTTLTVSRPPYVDPTGLSSGLGDEEPDPPAPVKDMSEAIPSQGGLTDDELARDMELDDPEHEAKVDASSVESSGNAEEAFSQITGIPIPLIDPEAVKAAAARRRRPPLKTKAKVSAWNGTEVNPDA